jgi:hypothetical protein
MSADTTWPLNVKPLLPLKMIGTTHKLTQHHILVDLNPQVQCCEILKSCSYLCWLVTVLGLLHKLHEKWYDGCK